ncbi:MAG: archaellin/type IV pilin N-terminal domain-containing protein [Nanoarchaeota archaeon]
MIINLNNANFCPKSKRSARALPLIINLNNANFCPKSKRSVSPVIATILLIALTLIIALIVFQWMRGFTKEAVTKFDGTNIELFCDDVQFDADYSTDGTLTISNLGNVPIYNFDIKSEYSGGYETNDLETINPNWDGLSQGGVFSGSVPFQNNPTKITLIPILLGINKDGEQKTQACDERHGKKIFI